MAVKFRQTHVTNPGQSPMGNMAQSAWLLYIFNFPYLLQLLSKLLSGEFLNLVLISAVFLANLLAAMWMSIGLKNKRLFLQSKYANDKPFPMMFLASLVIGLSCFVTAWLLTGVSFLAALGNGVAGLVGCWLWYGLDPLKSRHISFSDIHDGDRALQILQESESLIVNIEQSSRQIDNVEMSSRLNHITAKARKVLDELYNEPKKISQARRFLNTYLEGTERVVIKYARTHKHSATEELEENFKEVLVSIEEVFDDQYNKLISSEVFDLDVDIEVLNTLLKKQGIN